LSDDDGYCCCQFRLSGVGFWQWLAFFIPGFQLWLAFSIVGCQLWLAFSIVGFQL
jgi:hypothetical protein